jgi:hypothetical protein
VKNVAEAVVEEVVVVTIEVDVATTAIDAVGTITVEPVRPMMVSTLPPTNVPRTSVAVMVSAAVDVEVTTTAMEPKEVKAVTSEEAVTEEVVEEAAPKVRPPRRTTLNLKLLKLNEEYLTYEQAT